MTHALLKEPLNSISSFIASIVTFLMIHCQTIIKTVVERKTEVNFIKIDLYVIT